MNATYKLVVDGCIRYVGKTKGPLAQRLAKHLSTARRETENHSYLFNWLRSLDQPPTIELIEETATEDGSASEIYWIALAKDCGCRLVNSTEGGEGITMTPEIRAKISVAHLGKKHTPETITRMSGANNPRFGKSLSPEHCEKIRVATLGERNHSFRKKKSPESIAKRSAARRGKPAHLNTIAALVAANTGRKRTPETRAKISAKATGRKASPAAIEKNRAGHLGKSPSLETREKLRLAIIGRKHTPEAIANMRAAALRRRVR